MFSALLMIFLVMDPFGNIPFFVGTLRHVDPSRHRKIIVRELLIALMTLMLFMFAGKYILQMLHISEPSLTLAGGLILLLISIKMIFPGSQADGRETIEGEPFIVPLAIPYVAGPSAMATVMLIFNREPGRWMEWLLALVVAWLLCSCCILASGVISRKLGNKALAAVERLMGMVLSAMAVQMIMTGIARFIQAMPA